MKGKIFSFLKKLGLTLLILFIVFLIFLAYGHINNRWYRLIYIKSDSMSPTFRAGDLICITKPPEIKPGMIICFQIKKEIVTHRVMAVNEDGSFKTKGDANEVADDWGDYQIKRVAGIYRFKIPYLGYPIGYCGYWAKKAISETGKFLKGSVNKLNNIFIGSSAYFANQDKILMDITAEDLPEDPPRGENLNSEEGQNVTEIQEGQPSEDKTPIIDVFTISNDELTTESHEVVLDISASDDVTPSEKLQMRIINDEETWPDENAGWEAYSTNKNWQLSEEEGEKKVCLQIKDEAGNIASASDTINYKLPADNENAENNEDGEDNENTEDNEETTEDEEN